MCPEADSGTSESGWTAARGGVRTYLQRDPSTGRLGRSAPVSVGRSVGHRRGARRRPGTRKGVAEVRGGRELPRTSVDGGLGPGERSTARKKAPSRPGPQRRTAVRLRSGWTTSATVNSSSSGRSGIEPAGKAARRRTARRRRASPTRRRPPILPRPGRRRGGSGPPADRYGRSDGRRSIGADGASRRRI